MFLFNSKKRRFSNFLKHFGEYLIKTSLTVFNVSVITFIVYFAIESFKAGLVSNYFDINYLLVLAILSGLIVVLFNDRLSHFRLRKNSCLFSLLFAILLALFLFINLHSLGKIGLIITYLGAISIYLIINLFNHSQDD